MHRSPALMRARRLVCDASMVRSSRGYRIAAESVGCAVWLPKPSSKTKSTQIYPTNEGLKPSPSSRLPTYVPRSPHAKRANHLAQPRWHSFVAKSAPPAAPVTITHRTAGPVAMASMTTVNLALGSRAAVRGAKVQQKRTVAAKKVAAAARAELSQGERPGESSWQLLRRLETLRNRVRSRANDRPRR